MMELRRFMWMLEHIEVLPLLLHKQVQQMALDLEEAKNAQQQLKYSILCSLMHIFPLLLGN